MVRSFPSQIEKNSERINTYLYDFLDEFISNLKDFALQNTSNMILTLGEEVFNNLNQTLPLKNDYVKFIELIFKTGLSFDPEIITAFFEKLSGLLVDEAEDTPQRISSFDNYKFLINEIFISTVALSLKRNQYELMTELFYCRYFVPKRYHMGSESDSYTVFNTYPEYFDEFYKQHTGQKLFSPQATFMINRLSDMLKKEEFVNGDLLCYYVAQLNGQYWFPKTYIYKSDHSGGFLLLSRLVSKRHFERIKNLLGVDSVKSFVEKVLSLGTAASYEQGYSMSSNKIPGMLKFIKIEDIATAL
jgi:hypothetical protein